MISVFFKPRNIFFMLRPQRIKQNQPMKIEEPASQ